MNNQDNKLLEEAYSQVHEGIFDRFKKGAAELKTAVKGTGQQLKGTMRQGAGKIIGTAATALGSSTGATIGSEITDTGTAQKNAAAAKTADAGKTTYINSVVNSITKDMTKLGYTDSSSSENLSNELKAVINKYYV